MSIFTMPTQEQIFMTDWKPKTHKMGLLSIPTATKKLQHIINTYYSGFIVDITYSPHT
jgi:hypothetical protein